jgi:hypothetical protein
MQSAPELTTVVARFQVPLASISTDLGSQGRVKIHPQIVREYAVAMRRQTEEGKLRFPAIVLFCDCKDGGQIVAHEETRTYWIGDGFHRVLAAKDAGLEEMIAEVRQGNQRDALLYSLSANSAHGLPRTNADKRRAVSLVLADSEWSRWNDVEIARLCQVSDRFVSKMRRASSNGSMMRERKVRRHGKIYEMNVRATNNADTQGESQPYPPLPIPTVSSPSTDALGIPLSEPAAAAFAAREAFQAAKALCCQLAKHIDAIARGPAGQVLRQIVDWRPEGPEPYNCGELTALFQKLIAAEPYASRCPNCYLAHPGFNHPDCKACHGRFWLTRTEFESCTEEYRRQVLAG